MIIEIGNILVSYLAPFLIGGAGENQFIDVLSGVVKVIGKTDMDKDNRPVRKTFPVQCSLLFTDCQTPGKYMMLAPDSSKGCIVFFEDISNDKVGEDGRKKLWKAQLRLVCWINKKKLGYESCSINAQIISTFLASFPDLPFNTGIFQQVDIQVTGEDPRNQNPFSKYSFDEDKTQYALDPYDYFSLTLDVNYQLDKYCITPFTKQSEITC